MLKTKPLLIAISLLFIASASQAVAEQRPLIVELFTAQGCNGCPDTNQNLEWLAQDPNLLVLTYSVDYWDYLGWRDTFARPEFTERQRGYRRIFDQRSVSTPQVIIGGRTPLSVAPKSDAIQQTRMVAATQPAPEIQFRETGDRVAVGSGPLPEGGADVIAIRYVPGIQTVVVSDGDNRGRNVRHLNVVKEIRHLGEWGGRPSLYSLPRDMSAHALSDEAVVVIVQSKLHRTILTAALL